MQRREFIAAGTTLAAYLPLRGWAADSKAAIDLPAKSLDGGDLVLSGSDVQSFAASMRGELLRQDHSSYDARRRIWNAMFDRRPALIACCSGAADVRPAGAVPAGRDPIEYAAHLSAHRRRPRAAAPDVLNYFLNPSFLSSPSRRTSHQPYCTGQRWNSGSAPSAAAACAGQFGS